MARTSIYRSCKILCKAHGKKLERHCHRVEVAQKFRIDTKGNSVVGCLCDNNPRVNKRGDQ